MLNKIVEVEGQRGEVTGVEPKRIRVMFPNVSFHGMGKWYHPSQVVLSEDQTTPRCPIEVEPPASIL